MMTRERDIHAVAMKWLVQVDGAGHKRVPRDVIELVRDLVLEIEDLRDEVKELRMGKDW